MPLSMGIVVSGPAVLVVIGGHNDGPPLAIEETTPFELQDGDQPIEAYGVFFSSFTTYLRAHPVDFAILKGSAVSLAGPSLAALRSAELRGVVQAALGTVGFKRL